MLETFARSSRELSVSRGLRGKHTSGERMNNGMELCTSRDVGGLYLAWNFAGNPCGINGGNAQFKPRCTGRKSVQYCIWDCLRLTEYASSWSNGTDSVIRITVNASSYFSAKSSLRFNTVCRRHRNENLYLRENKRKHPKEIVSAKSLESLYHIVS